MTPSDRFGDRLDDVGSGGSRERLPTWVGPLVETLSFWGAIALPVIYLPLLAVGVDDPAGFLTFLGLFGLHVVALIVGRSHRADDRE